MVATPVPITEMMSLQPVSGLLVAFVVDHLVLFLQFSGISRNIIDPSLIRLSAFAQMLLMML